MNEILLCLCLKHYGEWMAIYDSLQKREELKVKDIQEAIKEVDCSFVTLLDKDYCENLKKIYKPPFGLFCYGIYRLLNHKTITVYADIDDETIFPYLEILNKNEVNLLWIKPSNKEMIEIIKKLPKGNAFYMEQLKHDDNKTFQNLLCNEEIITTNTFVSEIWEVKNDVDYTRQLAERIYLGITKHALVLTKLKARQALALASYSQEENIPIIFLESLFDSKAKKLFANCEVNIVKTPQDLLKLVSKNNK